MLPICSAVRYPPAMRAFLPVGLVLACTVPNPLFDLEGTGSSGAPTTPGSSTAGESSGSTGAPTTGAASIGTSTGGSSTTSTVSSTTTGDPSTGDTTGDPSTGEPASCWSQKADGWPMDGEPLDDFADAGPRDPFLTPDGLGLWYIAADPPRPFLSTRASLGDPFPNGVQQALWGDDPAIQPAYPTPMLGGTELLFVSADDVYSAIATGNVPNKYALPVPLTPPSSGDSEGKVTATADSLTLLVTRRDGPPISADFPEKSDRFYQYTRPQPQPGAAYAGGAPITPMVGTLGLAICPALAPDGLHLFFSSTESATLTKANAGDVVAIYYTSRPDINTPWEPPQAIAITHGGAEIVCPSSVTSDGCQLAFHRFGLEPFTYSMYLAQRAP